MITHPLFKHFCGGSYQKEHLQLFWEVLLRTLPEDAVCYSDGPEAKGFAIWFPSAYRGTSVSAFLGSGGFKVVATMGLGGVIRLLRYEAHAQRVRLESTKDQGWYFYNLVTRMDCQGQGIGKSLMKPAFRLLDDCGDIAYLETHKQVNVPLYERYGFREVKSQLVPGSRDLTHYAMVRDPKQS